ncbi:MAG: hypothetical protein LBG81_04135 [Coriobacteriaceae bacterium]|jgi:predicted Fe-Mo cluster-binding NifX family protein|nr:hypothetical protein [Coriobacteriaceae bacterium]
MMTQETPSTPRNAPEEGGEANMPSGIEGHAGRERSASGLPGLTEGWKRIAVATRSGTAIDTHFGHAIAFSIFDTDGADIVARGQRPTFPFCASHGDGEHGDDGHDDGISAGQDVLTALSDCHAVLCSRIGEGARNALAQRGITAYDSSWGNDPRIREACTFGSVEDALRVAGGLLADK